MKTPEQIENEKNFGGLLAIGGIFCPILWVLLIFHWLGGGGRQER